MHACGIIVEYNPFHNGHLYHLNEAKKISKCDCLIAIMSPNFVQRGEPAIIDKWQRAQHAIKQGVDLVIELPIPYATQSGDTFAYGAISILKLLAVDSIVFGSECNDLQQLRSYLDIEYTIDKHSSYSKNFALYSNLKSNDILGIAYLKALQNSTITPYTIKRTNTYHDLTLNHDIASASAIRLASKNKQDITKQTSMAHLLNNPISWDLYYPLLQYILLTTPSNILAQRHLVKEGIEHLFKKNAAKYDNYSDFLNACVCKRYTRASIQRMLVHILLQNDKETITNLPPLDYIRPLAFNDKGRQYLKQIKDKVNICAKFNQIPTIYRELELKATQVYAYALNDKQRLEFIKKEYDSPCYISSLS